MPNIVPGADAIMISQRNMASATWKLIVKAGRGKREADTPNHMGSAESHSDNKAEQCDWVYLG